MNPSTCNILTHHTLKEKSEKGGEGNNFLERKVKSAIKNKMQQVSMQKAIRKMPMTQPKRVILILTVYFFCMAIHSSHVVNSL